VVRALACAAPALALFQIGLGIVTILTFKDLVPVTAHLLVAALLLADYVALLAMTREPAVLPVALGAPA
jgi:heme A synthase